MPLRLEPRGFCEISKVFFPKPAIVDMNLVAWALSDLPIGVVGLPALRWQKHALNLVLAEASGILTSLLHLRIQKQVGPLAH